tara:strand:+ start:2537 stop:2842 length:306 start_codon:yes stop_codon:yes gene_type:complete
MRHEAIYQTHPKVVSIDDKEGAFDKNGNSVTIDETKVAEELKKLQAEYDSKQYQRDRATSYPKIREQLDLLYHDMTAGKGDKTGEWYKTVNKVKTDNPKPE